MKCHSIPILVIDFPVSCDIKFLPLSLIILLGQPRRLMKRLILRSNTGGSLPGVKSKIIALLAADVYNVTDALKVLSDCQKIFLTYTVPKLSIPVVTKRSTIF